MQRRIQRAGLDLEQLFRLRPDRLADAVAMLRTPLQGPQDEHVERALKQLQPLIVGGLGHSSRQPTTLDVGCLLPVPAIQFTGMPLTLLHVSPHEIVVCKPAGLASEHTRDLRADALLARLRAEGFDDLRLVHRLDSPACGLMIVARTREAAAHYSAEIAERRWKKVYVAEVAAPIAQAEKLVGDHKAYLSTEGRRAVVVRSGGKPSFLSIIHAAAAAADRSHLLVRLHTG